MMTREDMALLLSRWPTSPVTRPLNVEALWRAVSLAHRLGGFPEALHCRCPTGPAAHFRLEFAWMGPPGLG